MGTLVTKKPPEAAPDVVFPRLHPWETLLRAWDRVEANEGGPGVDGVSLDDFELRLDEELQTLQRDLRDHNYRPQPLLRASMPKASGGRRLLAIPTVRDRVAQSGAALVITPILEPEFEAASFGFRRRRSVPHAVAQVRRYYEEGYRWVVDADIDSFFDEVGHEQMIARLGKSIPDPEFLALVRAWLTAPIRDGARMIERTRGLPQGGPISPVLVNLYLDRFDETLLARGLRLVRFADDFLILCKERPQAEEALEVTEGLLRELQLALDPDKTRVTHFDRGFRYLGRLFLRSLVLPSPNRLQRHEVEVEPRPAKVTRSAAAAPPTEPARRSPRLQVITPVREDTPIGRALTEALQAAGRESLVLPESPLSSERRPGREEQTAPAPASPILAAPPRPVEPIAEVVGRPPEPAAAPLEEPASEGGTPRPYRAVSPFRRTLYIQEQGTILARQGERLVVKKGEDVLLEVPAAKVDQVFVFGRCAITTPAMTFCLEEQIPVVLLSTRGHYYGLVDSPVGDRISLHRQQFSRAEDLAFCLATAKSIVKGKLSNCRVLLQRHQRRKRIDAVGAAIADIEAIVHRVGDAGTMDEVRGHEGNGAARYFEALGHLLPPEFGFTRRVRRPPTDPVNSLLSLGYTLCFYNLYGLIRGRGLHPYVGHLHAIRDRHPALTSDLIEEFRAPIVDSLVLYLVNAKILTAADFYRPTVDPPGACLLRDQGRKTFLKHFEQEMATAITHPHTGETADWRRAMDLQVAHMRQWIVGEVSEYRPMEIR